MTVPERTPPAAAVVRDLVVALPPPERPHAAELPVLRGVSFTAPAGQVTALVGANAAGKTTTLRTLAGVIAPSGGSLHLHGTRMGEAEVARPREVAIVPDDLVYPDHWSAHDLARLRRSVNPGFDVPAFGAALTRYGIRHALERRELSRGQITLLAVAAALAQHPRLLLLDEPLSRLDPLMRAELLDALHDHLARDGTSVLLSTHDLEGLERLVDHLVVMHEGRVILEGALETLREEHLLLEASRADLEDGRWPLIGPTRSGDTLRALVGLEDAAGLPPGLGLRRPQVSELVAHLLRAARPATGRRTP